MDSPSENPYQSPSPLNDEEEIVGGMAVKDRLLLQKCQQQMIVLGLLWIATGLVGMGAVGILHITAPESAPMSAPLLLQLDLIFAASLFQLFLGVLTCCKRLTAVYMGLILGYPAAFVNLLVLNLCPFLMLGIGLLLAHRILRWAKELHARGIPLTASARIPQ
jgi:hypothetical protein